MEERNDTVRRESNRTHLRSELLQEWRRKMTQ